MLRRLSSLFDRYAMAHFNVEGSGFQMFDAYGRPVGRVDVIALNGAGLRVAGWALAGQVTLHCGRSRASMLPSLPRHDVAQAEGVRPEVGFDLIVPRAPLPPGHLPYLQLDAAGSAEPQIIALPSPFRMGARLKLMAKFAVAVLRSAPAAFRWYAYRDQMARARIKANLGLELRPVALGFESNVFGEGAPTRAPAETAISIVLPVYNAFDLLEEVVERVLTHTDLPFRLIAVEDASPDARVRPWLRARAEGEPRLELIENAENLGFIGAVNRGLARAAERGEHVVLLNSDAFVPEGWASRLLAPITADASVASVTPMANDAEIFSSPALCKQTHLIPGMADRIDRVAATLTGSSASAEVPTGMGFAMAMNRRFLQMVPELDTAFGKGYGEEVDWCRKVAAKGGRNIGLGSLFVEHRGGESFGSETKLALVAKNNALIERRYPGYDAEVQRWIATDPLLSARMALALAWAGAWSDARAEAGEDALVPIYLAHAIGGGAENWLSAKIAAELEATGRPAVVLRVGGGRRWMVDVMSPRGMLSASLDETQVLHRLLEPIRRREVVYSCGVGDSRVMELPGDLVAMAAAAEESRVEVLFHDFYPLSPSYTLLGSDGRFRGAVPGGEEESADAAHTYRGFDGKPVGLAKWRATWGALIDRAEVLTCFSEDSAAHVASAYPGAAEKIRVRPHALLADVARLPEPAAEAPRVIGVLGNLGYHKGAAVISALAKREGAPRLVVLGKVDPAYAPPASVIVHGSYAIDDLPGLVATYGITEWLIPSIWPETFSYTTHEALATGLTVTAFALGAQGAAVAAAPNGRAVPLGPDEAPEEALAAALGA
ncbi:glycosyltransferase [Pseudoroseicyclus sp. CXY001]|uniref:glycosyltransferase n=1 Tax=Pseudoroseicyclus sp. CXY001 TaxID=3242492 RepID=UPI003570CC89